MKVRVTKVFVDKFTKEPYEVGRELDFEDEARVNDLVSRGLVEVEIAEEAKETKGAKGSKKK